MLRAVFAFVLGAVMGACTSQPPRAHYAPTRTELAADLEAKTVALLMREEGATAAYCSGVWVSDTSILTAQHCVEDGGPIEYAVRSDVFAPATLHVRIPVGGHRANVYASDPGHDLALLRAINAPTHPVARVSLASLRPGAFVQNMGHPLGLWWSYSSGDVAALRQEPVNGHDIVWLQTTAPISGGCSGGGLFDAQNDLVGIAHATTSRGQNLNLFVHAQYLDAFLRQQGEAL